MSFVEISNSCDYDSLPLNTSFQQPSNWSFVEPSINHAQQRELEVKKFIRSYLLIIIFVIGVCGNGLSLLVLVRKRMTRVSTYIYLAVLSVLDTVILTTGLLQVWLEELGLTSSKTYSNTGCKMTMLTSYVVSDSSVWLITSVTVERFIAVCYPLKAASMCRRKSASKIIFIIIFVFFLLNLHFLWTTELVKNNQNIRAKLLDNKLELCPKKVAVSCQAAKKHKQLINKVWPYLDACVYSFVPFIIIIILNSFIIKKISKARKKRNTMRNHSHAQDCDGVVTPSIRQVKQSKNKTTEFHSLQLISRKVPVEGAMLRKTSNGQGHESNVRLSCMLICISLFFLFMTMPVNILLIYNNLFVSKHHSYKQHWSTHSLVLSITEILMYLNHSTSFFLYCATGKKFREELKRMFSSCVLKVSCAKKRLQKQDKLVKKTQQFLMNNPTAVTLNSQVPLGSTSFH